MTNLPLHLKRLEAEAISILRETAASFRNPVLLYSIGKDSSVMLHMAMKAFAPGRLPRGGSGNSDRAIGGFPA